ncbi:TRAP transporter small permease [Celeribacter sp.]|uniref:TRAP transporter small permease n=1 Tax=Celeribacter sp. TaxID=1890673 RepID=UPI003A94523B
MLNVFHTVYRLYSKVLFFAALIAGLATFLIMWLISMSAFLRTAFNSPIPASVEISQALLVLCITFPFAYTQCKREHVRTIALVQLLPFRAQNILYTIWMILGCLIFAAATYGTFRYGLRSFQMNEMVWGAAIQFPLWPSKLAVSVGCALLTIQFGLDAIGSAFVPGFAPHDHTPTDDDAERVTETSPEDTNV